jgi:hypothetical protein
VEETPKSIDEEVELDIRRLLAPHRPVVVHIGDPLVDRHTIQIAEECEDRVPRGPCPP